ncbi:hypothetical protein Acr_15g0009210 [Actinidia rufa]|uniref:Uncharacterized protein n=1 Tax=Actinidia rufa TaxID=165716 RepID=A0A7J0FUE6_9ERIC|nr:hypothetical protein Acr_15g0009210 [Actinidia rufa]
MVMARLLCVGMTLVLTIALGFSVSSVEARWGSFAIQFGKLPKGTPISSGPNPIINLSPPTPKGHSEGSHFGMFPYGGLIAPSNPSGREPEQIRDSLAIQFGKLPKGTPIPSGPNPISNLSPPTPKGHSEGSHFGMFPYGGLRSPSVRKPEQRRGSLAIHFGKLPKGPLIPSGPNPIGNLRSPAPTIQREWLHFGMLPNGQPLPDLYNRNTGF